MAKVIDIKFGPDGEGTLNAVGLGIYRCLGRPGFPYKSEVTVGPKDKFENRWSSQYSVNLPWAILVHWQRGAFIHEMPATLVTNGGPTAGCIHLERGDAERVWRWATGTVRIKTSYPW